MIRSTSPPKSACPGVSTMLIFVLLYITAVVLAKIVIPLSCSKGFESNIRSCTSSLSRNVWEEVSKEFTNVVFPWSTCAIIAMFLISIMYPPWRKALSILGSCVRRCNQKNTKKSKKAHFFIDFVKAKPYILSCGVPLFSPSLGLNLDTAKSRSKGENSTCLRKKKRT